ncbi:hypothetical protein AB1Y20_005097 [Prymnesium parvum]|uniref:Calmodulin n=1 Tax=Prymnesium parvum TaxID=97485 RepID=A0AB34J4C1_PRYPA
MSRSGLGVARELRSLAPSPAEASAATRPQTTAGALRSTPSPLPARPASSVGARVPRAQSAALLPRHSAPAPRAPPPAAACGGTQSQPSLSLSLSASPPALSASPPGGGAAWARAAWPAERSVGGVAPRGTLQSRCERQRGGAAAAETGGAEAAAPAAAPTGAGGERGVEGGEEEAAAEAAPSAAELFLEQMEVALESKAFVYVVIASNLDVWDPYALRIVPYSWLTVPKYRNNHFTFSASGVTHLVMREGKQEAEFVSLSEWKREASLFRRLRGIAFFSIYHRWRAYSLWKMKLNGEKRQAAASVLNKEARPPLRTAIALNPIFGPALVRVRSMCEKLHTLPLHALRKSGAGAPLEQAPPPCLLLPALWREAAPLTPPPPAGRQRVGRGLETMLDSYVAPSLLNDDEAGKGGRMMMRPDVFLEATLGASFTEGQRSFLHRAQLSTLRTQMFRFARCVDCMVRSTLMIRLLDTFEELCLLFGSRDLFHAPERPGVRWDAALWLSHVCGRPSLRGGTRSESAALLDLSLAPKGLAWRMFKKCSEGDRALAVQSGLMAVVRRGGGEAEEEGAANGAAAGEAAEPARMARGEESGAQKDEEGGEGGEKGVLFTVSIELQDFEVRSTTGRVRDKYVVGGDIHIVPAEPAWKQLLDAVTLEQIVDVLSTVEPTLRNQGLLDFFEAKGHAVAQLIGFDTLQDPRDEEDDFELQPLLTRTGRSYLEVLRTVVKRNCVQLEALLLGYRSHLALYHENEARPPPPHAPAAPCRRAAPCGQAFEVESLRRESLDEFRRRLDRYAAQVSLFTQMRSTVIVGLFRVDATGLRDRFLPSPQRCLDEIHALLPAMASDECEALLQETTDADSRVMSHPDDVKEFVELTIFEQSLQDKYSEFVARFGHLSDMHELMADYSIARTDDSKARIAMLDQVLSSLRYNMANFENAHPQKVVYWKEQVEHLVGALRTRANAHRINVEQPLVFDGDTDPQEALEHIDSIKEELAELQRLNEEYEYFQTVLKISVTPCDEVDDLQESVQLIESVWSSFGEIQEKEEEWKDVSITEIDLGQLRGMITKCTMLINRGSRNMPPNSVVPKLAGRIEQLKNSEPVIIALRSPALRAQHWAKIDRLVGTAVPRLESLTLSKLIKCGLDTRHKTISRIALEATQEGALLETLDRVAKTWANTEFVLRPYKDLKDVYVLGSVDDVSAVHEETQLLVRAVASSPFVGPIYSEVNLWEKKLETFSLVLEEWLQCQRSWIHIEAIFSAKDMQRQLPEELKMFMGVDKFWRKLMKRVEGDPSALRQATFQGLLDALRQENATLALISKRVEEFLDTKRKAFPRFCFLSNDELIEILAQTRDIEAVQPHLIKCFDNIKCLEFSTPGTAATDVLAMVSSEEESVPFHKPVKIRGPVEEWMSKVEQAMQTTLHKLLEKAVSDYEVTPRLEWVLKHFAQPTITCGEIMWTRHVWKVFEEVDPLSHLAALLEREIQQLTSLAELVAGDLDALLRRKIVSLITADVHHRDITQSMVDARVDDKGSFTWLMQLKFNMEEGDQVDASAPSSVCMARQASACLAYLYEYQGATTRLVVTPLTDRCWMTITGALHLCLGASPSGPAGTGKTESVKDLAKGLATQCVVYNCSDQLDYKIMGKLFAGVAMCGCWTCLDEFNRIDIEVLSVVAQQLRSLRTALLQSLDRFILQGEEITLRRSCGVFITMNPGYAGRTELPDNLKALFRPVSMMVPDYALIAEIMLYAEGFTEANTLSRKMVKMFKLCSEQLSQQDHYDYGLRQVKSVLMIAGAQRRAAPDVHESVALIRAMSEVNEPRFIPRDLPLFHAIVGDLYPNVTPMAGDFSEVIRVIEEELVARGLQPEAAFVNKVVQLWQTINVRFGLMLVGPAAGGKTTATTSLQDALNALYDGGSEDELHQPTHVTALFPKCLSLGELYGEFNATTQEWQDGVGSSAIRDAVMESQDSDDWRWVVFDGPVDAVWIESMNTVLDDNKTLCLANAERIKLSNQMRILFEVLDLAVASPATVSRCGMVYVSDSSLTWRAYVTSWAQRELPAVGWGEEACDTLLALFDDCIPDGLKYVRQQCTEIISTCDMQLVSSLCALYLCLMPRMGLVEAEGKPLVEEAIPHLFAYCFVWTIGSSIDSEHWAGFDDFCRRKVDPGADYFPPAGDVRDYVPGCLVKTQDEALQTQDSKDASSKANSRDLARRPSSAASRQHNSGAAAALQSVKPGKGKDKTKEHELIHWRTRMTSFKPNPKAPFHSIFVPTVDTLRFSLLVKINLNSARPTLICGSAGVGKSAISSSVMSELAATGDWLIAPSSFSARTSADSTQKSISFNLDKRRKNVMGPPLGKRIALFIDDVNMAPVEASGAAPPIELLRQLLDRGGFYDRLKLFWIGIIDVSFLFAAGEQGGARNLLSPRFTRHCHTIAFPSPSDESMRLIFSSMVANLLESNRELLPCRKALVESSIDLFKSVVAELKPIPSRPHYTFNLRDMFRMLQGILMVRERYVSSKEKLLALWLHEAMRTYHDRLVDDADRTWLKDKLLELQRIRWRVPEQLDMLSNGELMFGAYMKKGVPPSEQHYEQVPSPRDTLPKLLTEYLSDYNSANDPLYLSFFWYAVEHISRTVRALRPPRGAVMMVGVGGSGQLPISRLASFICGHEFEMVEMNKGYGVPQFREELKKLYIRAGVKNETLCVTLNEPGELFLADVNTMLNSGEIADLFNREEMTSIVSDMRPICSEQGILETRDNIRGFFFSRVRANLRLILMFSPVGAFRSYCRMFPSLISCCTIDWYDSWPEEALRSVADSILGNVDLGDADNARSSILHMSAYTHLTVRDKFTVKFWEEERRRQYVTPRTFVELVAVFSYLIVKKRNALESSIARLESGLEKLHAAEMLIDKLQIELNDLQPVLVSKSLQTEQLLERVSSEKDRAAAQRASVEEERESVSLKAEAVQRLNDEAQADLESAMPAYNDAVAALSALSKQDLNEVKGYISPPALVRKVMEAVCFLLLGRLADWDAAKKVLSDPDLMRKLISYDKDNIPPHTIAAIKNYYNDPEFVPEVVQRVSTAAKSLCLWCRALKVYDDVMKEVIPKKATLAEQQVMLEREMATLQKIEDHLAEVVARVNRLEEECNATVAEKVRLADTAQLTQERLARADKLTSGLASEKVRWIETAARLRESRVRLLGDVFLASAFFVYCGPHTSDYRRLMIDDWAQELGQLGIWVPGETPFSLVEWEADPVKQRRWQQFGLPVGDFATENAILATKGRQWPLIIDPQGQAVAWIKKMYEEEPFTSLRVGKTSKSSGKHGNLEESLEAAVHLGTVLLLQDLGEQLDPSLDPAMRRTPPGTPVRVNSEVQFNENFQLYMTTELPNPHYLPQDCIKVTLINFSVTTSGLEDQLLGLVVSEERPELEQQRSMLIVQMARDAKELEELEEKLLQLLASSDGASVLDDESLVDTLAAAKVTALQTKARIEEREVTKAQLFETMREYLPVAVRGSLLYFVIVDLAKIEAMSVQLAYTNVSLITELPAFANMLEHFKANASLWLDWMRQSSPWSLPPPKDFAEDSSIRMQLLVKVLRPELLLGAIDGLTASILGDHFIERPPLELSKAFDDSSASIPLLFILSSGSDPMEELLRLSHTMGFDGKC